MSALNPRNLSFEALLATLARPQAQIDLALGLAWAVLAWWLARVLTRRWGTHDVHAERFLPYGAAAGELSAAGRRWPGAGACAAPADEVSPAAGC
ncbi:MAG: hypothetical protein U1E47_08305 [Rivihabitans pingtungensis]